MAAAKQRNASIKQLKFVQGVAAGKSGTQAALDAYDTDDPEVAHAISTENLRKPSIRDMLQRELEKQGITLEAIIKPVVNALNDDDIDTQLKGHDRAVRLIMPKEEANGNTFNFFNVTTKEQDEFGL